MTEFTPKPFTQITADMVEHVRGTTSRLTDFNIGSVIRTILEATAIELDDYYQALTQAIQEAVPASLYKAFGFERLPLARASGKVRVTLVSALGVDFTLNIGAGFSTAGGDVNFISTETLVIPAGQTVGEVRVEATVPGVVGNVPADTVILLPLASPNISSVTNPLAMTLGRDNESDSEMQERFAAYILALSRATPAAIEYISKMTALTDADGIATEYVERVAIAEGAGICTLYIHNGAGNTSQELIAAVQRQMDGYYDPSSGTNIPGYRAAGVWIDVRGMTDKVVTVTLSATVMPGYWVLTDLEASIITAVQYAISSSPSGSPLPLARLINAALSVNGVRDCLITIPSGAVSCAASEALVPGGITVTWT